MASTSPFVGSAVCNLNTGDLPELRLANPHVGKIGKSMKRHRAAAARTKNRCRTAPRETCGCTRPCNHFNHALEPVLEDPDVDSDSYCPIREENAAWSCDRCTFLNKACMHFCEMCESEAPQAAILASIKHKGAGEVTNIPLPSEIDDDAWSNCDISSVASSWLDIGGMVDREDDTDQSFIDISALDVDDGQISNASSFVLVRPATVSWAQRVVQSDASGNVDSKLPRVCKPVPMPPLIRSQPPRRKTSAKPNEEEVGDCFDVLQQERHRGRQWQKHRGRQ